MNIKSLKPGMVVYDVGRRKMGNTTMTTVSVWRVRIIAIDGDTVTASWNGNAPRKFHAPDVKGWRKSEPVLVKSGWAMRLATRAELAAIKAKP